MKPYNFRNRKQTWPKASTMASQLDKGVFDHTLHEVHSRNVRHRRGAHVRRETGKHFLSRCGKPGAVGLGHGDHESLTARFVVQPSEPGDLSGKVQHELALA